MCCWRVCACCIPRGSMLCSLCWSSQSVGTPLFSPQPCSPLFALLSSCNIHCSGELNVNGDRDDHGNTLLITAAQNGLKRVAKLLLQKGAMKRSGAVCVGSIVLWTLLSG